MQVVFVHGVNTRDLGDGSYDKWVAGRSDRLNRQVFGGNANVISPYWGAFGLQTADLKTLPSPAAPVTTLGLGKGLGLRTKPASSKDDPAQILPLAQKDFAALIGTLSIIELAEASDKLSQEECQSVEDFWFAAAKIAAAQPRPKWVDELNSDKEFLERLNEEVSGVQTVKTLGLGTGGGNLVNMLSRFGADQLRSRTAAHQAQFLGDAMMFFARREQSEKVRAAVIETISKAAKTARSNGETLVLIGYSMGGGVLHEVLTDPECLSRIEEAISGKLQVDLLLNVGTQVGLFEELRLFSTETDGQQRLPPALHWWNVYDYNDTLAYLLKPVFPSAEDLRVDTSSHMGHAHQAYFDNSVFLQRLNARVLGANLIK
ncbi:hypothetical protein [Pelagibacterium montanilacus]|uniref:hypothetical protein n=1 Tax=Pelagibacterium montanilacus TaxID=2185280 RepID=UPI000F8C438E|nr:hypothetical protein [Pelagibacterium montanilacus]